MSSVSKRRLAWTVVLLSMMAVTVAAVAPSVAVLRVCADPNNLPFSNAKGGGYENAIASLVARDLGRRLEYYWQPQRRGFMRTTILAKQCDVVIGVPRGFDRLRLTRPYYRSTYVFVTRQDRQLDIQTFDDERLAELRIGIQVVGDDYGNPPPAEALASRQLVDHIRGFPVYGDYSQAAPQRPIVDAVAEKQIDVAIVWGPVGGYFGRREPVPLRITPVKAVAERDHSVFAFDLAVGVRREDESLASAIDNVLERERPAIRAILARFDVPVIPGTRK